MAPPRLHPDGRLAPPPHLPAAGSARRRRGRGVDPWSVLARVVAVAGLASACAPAARDARPAPAAPPAAVAATVHGPASPEGAPGQSLRLVRYEIAPGARLPPHRHEGTQVGLVAAGTLTYRVLAGRVPVYRSGDGGGPALVRELGPGEEGAVAAGEWVVETADDHHRGANLGQETLVIYAASLLREGAPLATPVPP
jgi:hypothetical protein